MFTKFLWKKSPTPFDHDFYKAIMSDRREMNVVLSPFTMRNSLLILYLGLNGKASDIMIKILKLDRYGKFMSSEDEAADFVDFDKNNANESFEYEMFRDLRRRLKAIEPYKSHLFLENRFFVDFAYEIHEKFKKDLKMYLNTDLVGLNFLHRRMAAMRMNKWAADKTKNQIVRAADHLTFLIGSASAIMSVAAFTGTWKNKFPLENTHRMRFYLSNTEHMIGPMMSQKAVFRMGKMKRLKCWGIEMPYENHHLKLIVLVPFEVEGLRYLEKHFDRLDFIDDPKQFKETSVHLFFPRIELFYEMSLIPVLEKLGGRYVFNAEADYNMMCRYSRFGKDFEVSEIKHRACFKAVEGGTENLLSNSVTSVKEIETSCTLRVDHPFFFYLKDHEHVYFYGRIVNLHPAECDFGEMFFKPKNPRDKRKTDSCKKTRRFVVKKGEEKPCKTSAAIEDLDD